MQTRNDTLGRLWLALLVIVVMTAVTIGCVSLGLPRQPVAAVLGLVTALVNFFVLWR